MTANKTVSSILSKNGVWDIASEQTNKILRFIKKIDTKFWAETLFVIAIPFVMTATYKTLKQENSKLSIYLNTTNLNDYHMEGMLNTVISDAREVAHDNNIPIRISLGAFWNAEKNFNEPESSYFEIVKDLNLVRVGAKDNNDVQSIAILYHELAHALYFNSSYADGLYTEAKVYNINDIAQQYTNKLSYIPYKTYQSESFADIFAILQTIKLSQIHPELKEYCDKSIQELIALRALAVFDLSHAHSSHLKKIYDKFKNDANLKKYDGAFMYNLALNLNTSEEHKYSWSYEQYWFNAFSAMEDYTFQVSGSSEDKAKTTPFQAEHFIKQETNLVINDPLIAKWQSKANNQNPANFLQDLLDPHVDMSEIKKDIPFFGKFIGIWLENFKYIGIDKYPQSQEEPWKVLAYYVNIQYQTAWDKKPMFSYEETIDPNNMQAKTWVASQYLANLQPLTLNSYVEYSQLMRQKESTTQTDQNNKIIHKM